MRILQAYNEWQTLKKENPASIIFIATGYLYQTFNKDAVIVCESLGLDCVKYGHDGIEHLFNCSRTDLDAHIKQLMKVGYGVAVLGDGGL